MKDKNEQQLAYEPPRVEVITVEIEKGFAASIGTGGHGIDGWTPGSELNGSAGL